MGKDTPIKQVTVTAGELSKQIKVLERELFLAKAHFDVFMGLLKVFPQHENDITCSPVFWNLTRMAHTDAAMLHLCRIYVPCEGAISLPFFLRCIADNPHLFSEKVFSERHKGRDGLEGLLKYPRDVDPSTLDQHIDYCTKTNPIIKKLYAWRHNMIAHYNYKGALSPVPFHQKYPFPYQEMEQLIDSGFSIINSYSSLLDACHYSDSFASKEIEDYTYVLQSLRYARVMRERNRKVCARKPRNEMDSKDN